MPYLVLQDIRVLTPVAKNRNEENTDENENNCDNKMDQQDENYYDGNECMQVCRLQICRYACSQQISNIAGLLREWKKVLALLV